MVPGLRSKDRCGFLGPVLERHLQILKLSTELVYLAKLYDVSEGSLAGNCGCPQRCAKRNASSWRLNRILPPGNYGNMSSNKKAQRPPRQKSALTTHLKAASRLRAFLKLARRRDFSKGYEPVAVEFSATAQRRG